MSAKSSFEGRVWKFGDNVPTDVITPIAAMTGGPEGMRRHVLESAEPRFPVEVEAGDVIVAGRNFGCSSGRAVAPKAIKATGIGIILAETFSRTFYRNAFEIGLPIMEVPGIHEFAETGDRLAVAFETGTVRHLGRGDTLTGNLPPAFLLEMLRAGGLIPLLASGTRFIPGAEGIRR